MKLVIEKNDQKYIDNINAEIKENGTDYATLLVNELRKPYKISFECTDIAKANRFILMLLSNSKESKEFIENAGIKVLALHYEDNKADVIQILEDTIARLKSEVL